MASIAPLSEAHTAAQESITQRLIKALLALFTPLDKYDHQAVERYANQSAALTRQAQFAAYGETWTYLDEIARMFGIAPPKRQMSVPPNLRGALQEDVMRRPVVQYRWMLSDKYEPERVERVGEFKIITPDEAESETEDRVRSVAEDDVNLAARVATVTKLSSIPQVTGYRRVLHPELSKGGVCGLCLAAADRVYHVEQLLPIHDRCKCTVAPMIRGEEDPGQYLNQIDLKKLYGEAGGTDAANLKKVRYQVDAHGELGAVLEPKKNQAYDRNRGKSPEEKAADVKFQIAALEKSVKDLTRRAADGEDLTMPLQWQRKRIKQLRDQLAA